MPGLLASDIMNGARVALNDVAQDLYTNTVLLPLVQIANDDLSDDLVNNGVNVQKQTQYAITVPPSLTNPQLLTMPNDLITPIQLFEKQPGDTDDMYVLMTQRDFDPNIPVGPTLQSWTWRDQAITIPPCTNQVIVRLDYWRLLLQVSTANSPIEVQLTGAKNYMIFHTASLAAMYIGKNPTEAAALEGDATKRLGKFINIEVKTNQGTRVRRIPFRINTVRRRPM